MTRPSPDRPAAVPEPAIPTPESLEAAHERLRQLGARVTQPRLCILACLIGSDEALTHQAVIDRLPEPGETIDRVTVYRVLDWLVEQGVAQKRAGNDRVFRFSLVEHEAARAQEHRQHSHFHCTRCDRTFCLDDASAPAPPAAPRVPSGFAIEHVELTVNGVCAECGKRAPASPGGASH